MCNGNKTETVTVPASPVKPALDITKLEGERPTKRFALVSVGAWRPHWSKAHPAGFDTLAEAEGAIARSLMTAGYYEVHDSGAPDTVTEEDLVKARNLEFRKAGKMRKRVMLAKDVLGLLNAKKLVAVWGTYANLRDGSCDVCALGGLVEACFLRNKEDIHDDDVDQPHILEKLSAFFDGPTLTRIEVAFERSTSPIGYNAIALAGGLEGLSGVRRWCYYYHADARLRLIMANIINNRGEFRTDVPPTYEDYKVGGVAR